MRQVMRLARRAYFVNAAASRNRCARAPCERSSWLLYFAARDSHMTLRASVYKGALRWIVDLRAIRSAVRAIDGLKDSRWAYLLL